MDRIAFRTSLRRCPPDKRKLYDQQMEELAKFDNMKPEPLPTAMSVPTPTARPPPNLRFARGNYLKPGKQVTPGFPHFLGAACRNRPARRKIRTPPDAARRRPSG